MTIKANADLTHANTMRLPACAQYSATPRSETELVDVLDRADAQGLPVHVLGGGSNVLLAPHIEGLVLQPALKGISPIEERNGQVVVEVMAGERWPDLVAHTLNQNWCGLENLSLIPGTAGAAPVQNIGAYGLELAERLLAVRAWHRPSRQWHWLDGADCQFGYRDSLFKRQAGQWLITRIRLQLSERPDLRLHYGDVAAEAGLAPTPQSVAAAVIRIRRRKLPDPDVLPNVGSFFKNPLVPAAQFDHLKANFANLSGHRQANGQIKLAAGWLIEQAGWKGRGLGPVKMHDQQALVMVNTGGASRADVDRLTAAIQHSVQATYDVTLEPEPVRVGGVA